MSTVPGLETRKPTDSHKGFIRTIHSPADTEFGELLERVYAHHPAAFKRLKPRANVQPSESNSQFPDLPNTADLASHFYAHDYTTPVLRKAERRGPELNKQEFAHTYLLRPPDGSRNNLTFLLGEVGSGKTTFLNWLITEQTSAWVRERRRWFLRLDVYLVKHGGPVSTDELIYALVSKAIRVLGDHDYLLDNAGRATLALRALNASEATASAYEKVRLFASFIGALQEDTGMRPLLFIDNVDYLYHMNDRTMFTDKGIGAGNAAIQCVHDLVHSFMHDGEAGVLGDLGANVVFSLRPDSYDLLRQSAHLFKPGRVFDYDRNVVFLEAAPWQTVVRSRGGLLQHAVSLIRKPGKRDIHKEVIDPILRDLEYQPPDQPNQLPLIGHLEKITNYGLRDIIDFFSQYSWLEGQSFGVKSDSSIGLDRLLHSYPVGLLAFMLGGHRRFNQFRSHFPNIYLVNLQEDALSQADVIHLSPSHEHTYWLKKLILMYVELQQERSDSVKPANLYEVFSPPKGYKRELVQACLGSMAQADVSNLLRVHKSRSTSGNSVQVEDITLSIRGQHCLGHIFDRFFYLQLVIDDFMLPLPRVLHEYFRFDADSPDYGYIGALPSDYREVKREMVRRKAFQVLLFLEVLDVALICEQIRYEDTFSALADAGLKLPRPGEMQAGVVKELASLDRVGGVDITGSTVLHKARSFRPALEKHLAAIYNLD